MRQRLVKVGFWLGSVYTVVNSLVYAFREAVVWPIGDIREVRDWLQNRGDIMSLLVAVLASRWTGPMIVVICLVLYFILEHGPVQRLAVANKEKPVDSHSLKRAKLEILFETDGAYRRRHSWGTHIRFGVYNNSDVAAENVEVSLSEIQPQPSYESFDPDLPYPVRRVNTGQWNHRINPLDEERFDMLWFWMTEVGGLLMVDGIDTKRTPPTQKPDTGWITSLEMRPNEHWHMTYRITCANADQQTVKFFVKRVGDEVQARRV